MTRPDAACTRERRYSDFTQSIWSPWVVRATRAASALPWLYSVNMVAVGRAGDASGECLAVASEATLEHKCQLVTSEPVSERREENVGKPPEWVVWVM
jgi:hypothetical protein